MPECYKAGERSLWAVRKPTKKEVERVINAINTLFCLEKEVSVALYHLKEEIGYEALKRVLRALPDEEKAELEEKLRSIHQTFCS